jgi:hypothetical protein
VEAELIGRPATWLGRRAATWRVTASAKSVEVPHGATDENRHTRDILEIPLAKLPFLV